LLAIPYPFLCTEGKKLENHKNKKEILYFKILAISHNLSHIQNFIYILRTPILTGSKIEKPTNFSEKPRRTIITIPRILQL